MKTVYSDNFEEITKKAFTRRVNKLKARGVLHRIATVETADTVYINITLL